MRDLQLFNGGEELLAVLHDVFSLMSVNINAFLVADGLKTKLVNPANCSAE